MTDPTPETTPTRDEAVPERPRIEPLLKDGDVVERLKQFRMRWQESGDLTYLGKTLVDAIVEIEALRKALDIPALAERIMHRLFPQGSTADRHITTGYAWERLQKDIAKALEAELLASAPAPASGGVHAVREALLGYVLKPGQYEMASAFARGQNRVAVDMLGALDEASLSPAATPVSGADMIPRAKNVGRYLAETNDGRLLYLNHATEWQEMPNILAKPASSPAGGDVVQTLIDKTEKLIEAADDMGWSCNSSSADQAIREAKDAVRAALSQSTSSHGEIPTASGETVGSFRDRGPAATQRWTETGPDQNSTAGRVGE